MKKSAEKVEEKTGQLLGEKIYDKFSSQTKETKGKEIGEILRKASAPEKTEPGGPFQAIKDVYDDLL